MLLAPLAGAALLMTVSIETPGDSGAPAQLSIQEKAAATEPLVRSATDCIIRAVTSNPGYAGAEPGQLGDLIVASMPACLAPVRAMIDAYDRYYGAGTGEAFFMGPYLEVLPKAVIKSATGKH